MPAEMIRLLLLLPILWVCALPVQAEECSTAFVCDVVNYQRMHLDGRLQKLPAESFGFRLEEKELTPQQGGSPLGDGTLNYEIRSLLSCGADGRLIPNSFTKSVQFEGGNGLYAFEYMNGRILISSHVHHEYYDLTSARCREM